MSRILFAASLLALSAAASASVVSTFQTNDEGWKTCNFNFAASVASGFDMPKYSATGGESDGFISTDDVDFWCFLAAPAKFLGDDSSAFGTGLSFYTRVDQNDGYVYPSVVLQGNGLTLYSVSPAPGKDWTGVSIPLVGASWMLSTIDGSGNPVVNGAPVSDAVLKSVLGNLTGLYIEADWVNDQSTDETTGLDEVRLETQPVPEPAALAPLAFGALAFLKRRKALR